MKKNTDFIADMATIEIFKTNVNNPKSAAQIISSLESLFPSYQFNFDLEDCDRILRIEGEFIDFNKICGLLNSSGYQCEILQ
jgi:hypothetical protein